MKCFKLLSSLALIGFLSGCYPLVKDHNGKVLPAVYCASPRHGGLMQSSLLEATESQRDRVIGYGTSPPYAGISMLPFHFVDLALAPIKLVYGAVSTPFATTIRRR